MVPEPAATNLARPETKPQTVRRCHWQRAADLCLYGPATYASVAASPASQAIITEEGDMPQVFTSTVVGAPVGEVWALL